MLSLLQKTSDRCFIIFLFVLVSPNSNLFYGMKIMKKYLIRYMKDLRILILISLLTWWILVLIYALIGGRSFFTHHYGHDVPTIYYILFILPFTYTIPPLFYQLYKKKWLNVGFLLLVWLSPLALWDINTSFWYSLLYHLGINR